MVEATVTEIRRTPADAPPREPPSTGAEDEKLVEADLPVEDVSIDGKCGVD
jgi:mycofactocin precursor